MYMYGKETNVKIVMLATYLEKCRIICNEGTLYWRPVNNQTGTPLEPNANDVAFNSVKQKAIFPWILQWFGIF